MPDPLRESWRYARFPELNTLGIRDMCSERQSETVWFALDSGAMSYDGYIWQLYNSKDLLTGLPVQRIFASADGRILAATSDGIFAFASQKWQTLVSFAGADQALIHHAMIQLADGTLACAGNYGLFLISETEKRLLTSSTLLREFQGQIPGVQVMALPAGVLHRGGFEHISDLVETPDRALWMATTYLDDEKGDIIVLQNTQTSPTQTGFAHLLSEKEKLTLGSEQHFTKTPENDIWVVSSDNKLSPRRYRKGRWEVMSYGAIFGDDEYSEMITSTPDGKVWIGGIGNLYAMDRAGSWSKYNAEIFDIPQSHVRLHAAGSGLWVYGHRSTVYRIELSDDIWQTYESLNYMGETQDSMRWFLTSAGEVVQNKDQTWQKMPAESGLIDNPVRLYLTREERLWAIGSDHGAAAAGYLDASGHWVNFRFETVSWSLDYRDILEAANGDIWLGGCTDLFFEKGQKGGMIQISDPYSASRTITLHPGQTNGYSQINVYGMAQTKDGQIWAGGSKLHFYDGRRWFLHPYPDFQDFVNTIHTDSTGRFYVGSRQHGLFVRWADEWTNYSIRNGLLSNNIISIATSGSEEIWLATERDISYYNGAFWINNIFPTEMNLTHEGGELVTGAHGDIWINQSPREWKRRVFSGKSAHGKNWNKFKTHHFTKASTFPDTHIEIYTAEVDPSGNTTISWSGKNYFNLYARSDLTYSFRLNGGNWSLFSPAASHTFTGLSSGSYTLQVRAMNKEGNIDPTPAEIHFEVKQPVWMQPWFLTLIGTFLITVLYFQIQIYRKRMALEKLNHSLHQANSDLEEKNRQVEQQKTSLEAAVKTIDELSQAKVKFFTNITHEFRTPLSLILGPVERLLKNTQEPQTRNLQAIIRKNALRLQKLINQLLEVRRIEAGNLALQLHSADLVSHVREVISLFHTRAQEQHIQLRFTSEYDRLTICFDADKVEKILFNLLSNAFKHTPEKGSISIKILRGYTANEVKITLTDTGKGMTPEVLNHVFERFVTGQNNLETGYTVENTGVGLAYAKDLVEVHRGSIQVTSAPNAGTQFEILLPTDLQPTDADTPELNYRVSESLDAHLIQSENATLHFRPDRVDADRPAILIVEDNVDMVYFLRDVLSPHYNVCYTLNGQSALELLEAQEIQLILSDIMMPVMDGTTLCRMVRENPATSHLPIILLTAMNSGEHMKLGYDAGADSYLVKPFEQDVLLARIQNLLDARQRLQQNLQQDLRFTPTDVPITSYDEAFLDKLSSLIEKHAPDAQFDIAQLSSELHLSHSQFIRKVKQLTGKKPIELLKTYRLTMARNLLAQQKIPVSEVGYLVGYDVPNSFARAFKTEFGVSPSAYMQQLSESTQT